MTPYCSRILAHSLLVLAAALSLTFPVEMATAQIYAQTTETGISGIRKYDAVTGTLNGSFTPILGNSNPFLQVSGNTLYVVDGSSQTYTVKTYNGTTGAAISGNLTGSLPTAFPGSVVVSGNHLYYGYNTFPSSPTNSIVADYNSGTGALNNAGFITFPGASSSPLMTASGNTLFVGVDGVVGSYNATTGAAIQANLITGLNTAVNSLIDLAAGGGNLYVGSQTIVGGMFVSGFTVGKYSAATGAPINANLITLSGNNGMSDMAIVGNTLFVEYSGLSGPILATYDATTGASLNPGLLTNVSGNSFAAVPEPQSTLLVCAGLCADLGARRRRGAQRL